MITYEDTRDAEEAQYRMDRQRLFGREIEVEFARGDRKSKSFNKILFMNILNVRNRWET